MSNVKVLSQYVKDLSFENTNPLQNILNPAQRPNIDISINIDGKKIQENNFEVTLKIKAEADQGKIFICEIEYAGIFQIENIEAEMIDQVLLVYCPNLLFPFMRKIIASTVADGGFAPLMLDPIDFAALYQKRKGAN